MMWANITRMQTVPCFMSSTVLSEWGRGKRIHKKSNSNKASEAVPQSHDFQLFLLANGSSVFIRHNVLVTK